MKTSFYCGFSIFLALLLLVQLCLPGITGRAAEPQILSTARFGPYTLIIDSKSFENEIELNTSIYGSLEDDDKVLTPVRDGNTYTLRTVLGSEVAGFSDIYTDEYLSEDRIGLYGNDQVVSWIDFSTKSFLDIDYRIPEDKKYTIKRWNYEDRADLFYLLYVLYDEDNREHYRLQLHNGDGSFYKDTVLPDCEGYLVHLNRSCVYYPTGKGVRYIDLQTGASKPVPAGQAVLFGDWAIAYETPVYDYTNNFSGTFPFTLYDSN